MTTIKGIWFYGLAGSGKTLASKYIFDFISDGFLIDGDEVRKYVSEDLGYDVKSRQIQVKRIYGICHIAINNGLFPIASSVYLDTKTCDLCTNSFIKVIKIDRSISKIQSIRNIYKNSKNVVGKDIKLPDLNVSKIINLGTSKLKDDVIKILDQSVF